MAFGLIDIHDFVFETCFLIFKIERNKITFGIVGGYFSSLSFLLPKKAIFHEFELTETQQ